MSLCDGSKQLLENYGFFLTTNSSAINRTNRTVDSVFNHWCHYDSVPEVAHYLIGTILIIICTLSITGNLLVIIVFSRYRRLRSPANTLIINLAVSDMLNGFLHPMAVYSSFKEHWMFGRIGCELYAGLCGLFGLISIVTLTAIAIERCLVISVKPWYGGILFTQAKAKISIIIIWIYCFITMLPPLFGWGAFVPEGFLTSCSFDYITRTYSNRSYFFYIFILGFFLPITIITICYGFIMRTICQNEKDMKKNNVKKVYAKPRKRNDYKAAEMIMLVIAMFLMSWTPYSFIAYIGQFGNIDFISPWVSVLPSLFAKMSTIYNPAIYGLSHRHFRATLRRIFKKEQRSSGERIGTYFSKNSSINRPKAGCPCMPHYGASEVLDESSSFSGKKVYVGVSLANGIDTSRILYVKKPHTPPKQCPCESVCNSEPNSSLFNDVPNVNNDNSAKGTSSSQNGRPAILVMQTDNMSLFRSLMFKSESSIHQKYQTYIQKYHIVRVPSMICSYVNNFQQTGNKAIILHKTEFPLQVPTSYIRVLNMERIPLQTISPNTLQKSENLSRSDQDEAQIS